MRIIQNQQAIKVKDRIVEHYAIKLENEVFHGFHWRFCKDNVRLLDTDIRIPYKPTYTYMLEKSLSWDFTIVLNQNNKQCKEWFAIFCAVTKKPWRLEFGFISDSKATNEEMKALKRMLFREASATAYKESTLLSDTLEISEDYRKVVQS